jgi:hypothetical protein
VNDYRASVKASLKRAITEVERDWGSGAQGTGPRAHWVIVYVRPANVDPQDKVGPVQGMASSTGGGNQQYSGLISGT